MANQVQPKLIIHGGAGSSLKGKGGLEAVRRSLRDIVQQTYAALTDGKPAEAVVALGCRLLEDEPRFNAGTGSVLQSDGQVRMSAAIMVGDRQRFSGVINVGQVKNPIDLARLLQDSPDRVLSETGAALLAREQGIPIHSPLTDLRLQEWLQERQGNFDASMANVVAESLAGSGAEPMAKPIADTSDEAGRGTIGVVVRDSQGRLAVGTSTGGKGFERIGRVSDSAMPAGNYATPTSAISCTGIGEDIIDECLAPRIAVRVTDGYTLEAAFARSCAEAQHNQRDLGAIGLDHTGAIAWGKTSDILLAAYHTGAEIGDTLEVPAGLQTGGCP
ncbi:MAG: isoaspartyl peptidase/L-asparaginase [Elainellaceae cyanobacterium]